MEQQKFTIPGFRCYEITQDGRVFRKNSDRWIKTTLPDGELKQQIQVSRGKKRKQYAFVTLVMKDFLTVNRTEGEDEITDGECFTNIAVHRLMAMTFHGTQPRKRTRAVHIDGNTLNNVRENIRWLDNKLEPTNP